MNIKKWFVLLVVTMLGSACTDETKIDEQLLADCHNHYRAKSYRVAKKTCETAARAGAPKAQWLLGHIYRYGLAEGGVRGDLAFNWYLQAAKAGLIQAQRFVGQAYLYADGVAKDLESAFFWLSQAANNSDAKAAFVLGQMYLAGEGREKNIGSAVYWFERAALRSHSQSINNLAWLYATSKHGEFFDAEKAMYWSERLFEGGDLHSSVVWDTKAAVFAVAGEFKKAVEYQNKAIASLAEDAEESVLVEFQTRLEAYQNHQPWKE